MQIPKKQYVILLLVLITVGFQSKAQRYYGVTETTYGQNRLQTKRIDWKTIKSNNFEFNFYRGGEELAKKAAKKAESEYLRITETLGYTPFSVMKIFIFNNPEDVNQSNIGLTSPTDLDGGILNLSKARVELAYNKNDSLFEKQLIKEITTLFVYDMLYGGSLKEAVQSQLLLMVPDWYIKGISAYVAEPNNSARFYDFKAAIIANEKTKISHLKDEDSELIGQSIWHYIALKYGRDNISNILNLTRIIRNEQSSITSTLGVSYSRFLKEWKAFYVNNAAEETTQETSPALEEKNVTETPLKSKMKDLRPGEVDTDFYEFDGGSVLKYQEQIALEGISEKESVYQKDVKFSRLTEELKLGPTKAYQNLLVSNEIKKEILIDPVRKFGIGAEMILNDLLENHVISIGGYVKPSTPFFKNYDYHVEYANFSKKVDFKLRFDRRSVNFESIDKTNDFLFRPLNVFPLDNTNATIISRRVFMQKISASAAYPLSPNLRVEFKPFYTKTTDIEYEVPGRDNISNSYLSGQFNLVFDNTVFTSKQVQQGTKVLVSYDRNMAISNPDKNFKTLNIDARHYQKIVKGLSFAGRFNLGRSMGNSPKYSFLGGVENWINRSIYPAQGLLPGTEGDFQDILFYNFPGNLRGFEYARLFGSNYILTNLELRTSLSEYFPKSSLTSSFLRNLQFVLFSDIGTAWNGNKGPFSKQNSLNTILIGTDGRSPFFAEVTNFKNPFLQGFGVGLRTNILGLYVKGDYAWGREDKQLNKPMLHLSFGADF